MSDKNKAKERNRQYFQENLDEFLKNPIYRYKFLVIHGEKVRGAYDTFSSSLEYAVANFPKEEFIIQQVLAQDEQINFLKSAV